MRIVLLPGGASQCAGLGDALTVTLVSRGVWLPLGSAAVGFPLSPFFLCHRCFNSLILTQLQGQEREVSAF